MKNKILTAVALSTLINTAIAVEPTQMIEACVKTGEARAICECATTQWIGMLGPNEMEDAAIFVQAMASEQPPSAAVQQRLGSLMMRFQQVGMSCAMNAPVEEETSSPSIADFLPKGSMSEEDIKDFDNIMSGEGDVMESMRQIENRDMQRKAEEKAKRQAEQQKRDAELEKKRAAIDAEFAAIDAKPILSHPISRFEKLFKMRTELYGGANEPVECLWNTLTETAGDDEAGVLTVYFAAIGGGDFDQPEAHRPYLDEANQRTYAFQDKREACY